MQAIETSYKGYRFRSRLEARWAIFFDTLGIEYEYELQGYETEIIRYLPDFWLPDIKLWVEVKPTGDPDQEAIGKAGALALGNKSTVIIVCGDPHKVIFDGGEILLFHKSARENVLETEKRDGRFLETLLFTQLFSQHVAELKIELLSIEKTGIPSSGLLDKSMNLGRIVGEFQAKIKDAVAKARSARFDKSDKDIGLSPKMPRPIEKSVASRDTVRTQLPYLIMPLPQLQEQGEIKMLTAVMRSTGEKTRDVLRVRRIHGIITSYSGEDRFAIHVFEKGRGYLMEFPNFTTGICDELVDRLAKLVGSENVLVERLTFDDYETLVRENAAPQDFVERQLNILE